MRTSSREVGLRAGVSRMTVSRVLSGRGNLVTDATRQRVLEAVQALDYTPVVQPSLQTRQVRTKTLGLVFDEVDAAEDIYGLLTFRGLRQGALQHGYDLLVMLRPKPEWAPERAELQFLDRRCDGYIFVAPHERSQVLQSLVEHQIPAVSCHKTDVPDGVAHVSMDNIDAARMAVEYLVGKGHKNIAYASAHLQLSYFRLRLQGFQMAMKRAGLKGNNILAAECDGLVHPNKHWLTALRKTRATAVICFNDYYALALQQLAAGEGIAVPDDLSIVGFDGVPEAREYGLTSVEGDGAAIGRAALEALCALLRGESWESCCRLLPARLAERTSVAEHTNARAAAL